MTGKNRQRKEMNKNILFLAAILIFVLAIITLVLAFGCHGEIGTPIAGGGKTTCVIDIYGYAPDYFILIANRCYV